MVDKSTARLLVYGALATLGVILIVAIYALATKGSVQSELERKLDLLKARERDLAETEKRRSKAFDEFQKAQKSLEDQSVARKAVEEQRDGYRDEVAKVGRQKKTYEDESERLRRKLWDKEDQQKLEDLEKKSEAELMRELEEEGKQYFGEQDELSKEHLEGNDQKDLDLAMDEGKKFKQGFETLEKKLHDPGHEGDEEALENMEEFGEQNEVYLDELARDAKRNNGGKWKDKERPEKMRELAKDMDLHAEALRNKLHEKKLGEEDHALGEIEKRAKKLANDENDNDFAPAIADYAKGLEADEERLLKEMHDADENEELEAARMLEEDAEKDDVLLAKLEKRIEDDKNLTPQQKQEREELIKQLEREIKDSEEESRHIQKGLERRGIRKDAVKIALAANRLEDQAPQKLKHGKPVLAHAQEILSTEGQLLEKMKKGDVAGEEKYGRELAEEAEQLEEDAEHLYDEAEAGDFDLDEKLIDEQLAKELEDAAEGMERDAGEVEREDHARDVRDAGEEVEKQAEHLGDMEKQFGKTSDVKDWAKKVDNDAHELGRLVGEQAWDEESASADKLMQDADHLDQEADNLDKEINGAPADKLSEQRRKEDHEVVEQIHRNSARLKKEAQAIKEDVRIKAQHKSEELEQKLVEAKKLLDEKHEPAAPAAKGVANPAVKA